MNDLPPLHIHLLAHPKSKFGSEIASGVYANLVEPPMSGGLRLPVFFTPDNSNDLPPPVFCDGKTVYSPVEPCDPQPGTSIDLVAAQHSILVILADSRMAQRIDDGTAEQWESLIRQSIMAAPARGSTHHILPVAIEKEGFELGERQHFLPALGTDTASESDSLQQQIAEITLHLATRSLELIDNRKIENASPGKAKAPVSLFISHAKADLSSDNSDPAYETMKALVDLPIDNWFDAADIETSEDFQTAITSGIQDAAIVVAFHTDSFDSRPWCRREVLTAKECGAQLLLVSAVQDHIPRQFPYLGNIRSFAGAATIQPRTPGALCPVRFLKRFALSTTGQNCSAPPLMEILSW